MDKYLDISASLGEKERFEIIPPNVVICPEETDLPGEMPPIPNAVREEIEIVEEEVEEEEVIEQPVEQQEIEQPVEEQEIEQPDEMNSLSPEERETIEQRKERWLQNPIESSASSIQQTTQTIINTLSQYEISSVIVKYYRQAIRDALFSNTTYTLACILMVGYLLYFAKLIVTKITRTSNNLPNSLNENENENENLNLNLNLNENLNESNNNQDLGSSPATTDNDEDSPITPGANGHLYDDDVQEEIMHMITT